MMNRFSILLMAVAIFLFSCSQKDVVEFDKGNFPEVVNLQGNLTFGFTKDLVSDTLVDMMDTTNYLEFEPAIKGNYKWVSTDKLMFMPMEQLRPSTEYKARFTSALLKHKKGMKLPSADEFQFHTPIVSLLNLTAYWSGGESGKPVMKIDLTFNYLIEPAQAMNFIEINIGGEMKDFTFNSDIEVKSFTALIKDVVAADVDLQVKVTAKPGIEAVGGNLTSAELIEKEANLLSPFQVSVYDVEAMHDGNEGKLTVYTSQEIDEAMVKKYLKIEPELKYNLEIQPQGFIIKSSEFNPKEKYVVKLAQELPGKLGGKLKNEYTKEISFGKLRPSIKFVNNDRVYLSGKGHKNIDVNIVNVEKVKVAVYKLYENNIIHAMSGSDYYYDYWEDEYYYGFNYDNIGNMADLAYEKEIETKTLPHAGSRHTLHFDFEDKFSNFPGIYMVRVYSDNDYWLKDQMLVSISDIGLMVKEGKNFITVFANSIKTTDPLPNVKLKFIGQNNQLSGTATTDATGVASFKIDKLPADGFKIKLITASLDEDYNYLPFNRTAVNSSRFEVGGKYANPSGYDAFIFGDRDLYRPGETVNLACVIRGEKWQLPGEMPIKMKFIAPNGKEVKSVRKTLSKQGDFDVSFTLPPSAMTGTYTAQVYTSNDVFLASKNIAIEEFMPDRIKVDLTTSHDSMMMGENYEVGAMATNFFGPPAANRNYEASFSLRKVGFRAKTKEYYNFNITGTTSYFDEITRQGKTGESGDASESFSINSNYANMGALLGDLYFTVFDETGRPVNRHESVYIFTQDVFYGIGYGTYYVKTGNTASIPLVATDIKGKPLTNQEAQVTLIKHEYKSVLSKAGGYFRYRSEKEEKIIDQKIITLKGEDVSYTFSPKTSGKYEIRINKPGVNTYVSREFWSYGYGSTSSTSFEVNTEGNIDIELDKDNYKVGETAKVLLKAPFSGKMLVCVESDDVMEHFYLETDKRAASFDLPITDKLVPNVYISATLIKPHDVSDFPLLVAHGFHPLMVENDDNKMKIEIDAVEKTRSKTKQTIKIKSGPNARLTVAAVDEGILQISGFKTPDPYSFFYQKRALEVNSYDLYPFLFPEVKTGSSSTGGDGMDLGKRINPMTNERVKLVSLWSGIIETDSKGNASFDIDIPQFSGSLRLMAVSYRDAKFGSASDNMIVADPLVISAALPRFLSPADTIEVPVILTNTTDKETTCKTSITLEGPVDVIGKKAISVNVPANSEKEVVYRVSVQQAIGQAKVTVLVDAFGEKFSHETDMPVRPVSPLQKRSGADLVKAGQSATINFAADEFMPKSIEKKLLVSKSPIIQFADDLDYLVRYPYGCVEQTVSSVFPQLYFGDLVKDIYDYDPNMETPAFNIREAINKLMLMQLYNGSLTYWPGRGYESWWGSVYACHFLLEAKKAGYDVDESMLDKLSDYLREKLKDRRTIVYYYNNLSKRDIAPKEIGYSLYVLALAGKPQYATMNYYKARPDLLSLDGRYLLAAAYYLSGNQDKYKEVLPPEFSGEESNSVFGGSFYSYVRDEAISLNAMLEVDSDNPQVAYMAKHLTEMMKTRRYLNTQERAFAFIALGKLARKAGQSNITADIRMNGKSIATFKDRPLTLSNDKLNGTALEIKTEGTGQLYYFWESEGITADGSYRQEDSFLKVRKTLFSRSGERLTNYNFEQNDLIVVQLSIVTSRNEQVDNVAITDMLPAGFEIENTRLTDLPDMNWIKNASGYDYMDVRDDRISFFVNANQHTRYYYYFVRAVSPGTFQMGPVGADAMYNGEYHSYNGSGVVRVVRK